jgi:hypothetical protein
VTADFGNVTDSAGLALRSIDCRFPCQFWSSSGSSPTFAKQGVKSTNYVLH